MSPLMGNAVSIFNGTDAIVNHLSKREFFGAVTVYLQYFNRVAEFYLFIMCVVSTPRKLFQITLSEELDSAFMY